MINRTGVGLSVLPLQGGPSGAPAREGIEGLTDVSNEGTKPFAREKNALKQEVSAKEATGERPLRARERAESSEREESPFESSLNSAITRKRAEKARPSQKNESATVTPNATSSSVAATPKAPVVAGAESAEPATNGVSPTKVPILFDGEVQQETEESDLSAQSPGQVAAVLRFMTSMEREFGIQPQQMIVAMKDAQNLDANSASNRAFFEQLGLEGGQVRQGEYLYQNMLKEMAQDQMATYLNQNRKQMDVQLVNPEIQRRQALNSSLDQMNKNFFMGQPQVKDKGNTPLATPASPAQPAKTVGQGGSLALPAGFEMVQPQSAGPLGQAVSQPAVASPQSAQAMTAQANVLATPVSKAPSPQNPFGLTEKLSFDSPEALGPQPANTAPVAQNPQMAWVAPTLGGSAYSQSQNKGNGSDFGNNQGSAFDQMAGDLGSGEMTSSESFESLRSESLSQNSQPLLQSKNDPQLSAALASASVNSKVPVDGRPEDAMNVRNLIQSAQVLLRKGGGEMKVQMHPEGLGQVDLKVALKEGKVDIQLVADTSDTKRLLEKNMHELKVTLAAHKVDVQDVKVDVARNAERDLGQQSGDLAREQARQFLGQFREDREAFRQAFGEAPKSRQQYKGSAAQQIEPANSSDKKPATKNSSRLNVVV